MRSPARVWVEGNQVLSILWRSTDGHNGLWARYFWDGTVSVYSVGWLSANQTLMEYNRHQLLNAPPLLRPEEMSVLVDHYA